MKCKEIINELINVNVRKIKKISKLHNIDTQQATIIWLNENRKKIDNYLIIHATDIDLNINST